jgi:hypothetical protein
MALTKITGDGLATSGLPAGTVLQVVAGTYASQVNSSSSTFADTGLTATITPSSTSSKVLVIAQISSCFTTTNTSAELDVNLLRDSTQIIASMGGRGSNGLTTGDALGTVGCSYLDSPATTSATTYKCQFKSTQNNATASVGLGGTTSTITLMEIAG